MFIEVCIISAGLYIGSKVNQKIKSNGLIDGLGKLYAKTKQKTQKKLKRIESSYQVVMENKLNSFISGDLHKQQMIEQAGTEKLPELNENRKRNNRRLIFSFVNVTAVLTLSVLFPPMLFISVPACVWLRFDHFTNAWDSITKKQKFDIYVMDAIAVIWMLLTGYFVACAIMIFILNLVSRALTEIKGDSEQKLINVFGKRPESVWILKENVEVEVPFRDLIKGDIFVVNAGEIIPADGIVKKGFSSVDQRILTGESQPVEKGINDKVFASTTVLSGKIYVLAKNAGEETNAAKIGTILCQTIDHKTSLELATEKFSNQSAFPTFLFSVITFLSVGTRGALAVFWANPGYMMRLLGPLSNISFLRIASKNGILVKDGRALENLAKADTVVFDKTGTLTMDEPYVSTIHSFSDYSEQSILYYAAAAEKRQSHPIAKAIISAANKNALIFPEIEDGIYEIGYGVKGILSGLVIRVGSRRYMEMENIILPKELNRIYEKCALNGYSLVLISIDDKLSGAIELHPTMRPNAKQTIKMLKQSGITTYIISGDQIEPTKALAEELDIDHYFADTLPEQKAKRIDQLRKEGRTVCFIGDGINDSIALKKADISISLRGASTAAVDSAQIVLMDESLSCLSALFNIVNKFKNNRETNLIITLIPGAICIGGVFLFGFGIYQAMALFYIGLFLGIGNVIKADHNS